jgi:endonuclease/exonuclease/phosphatase family metal-dependent hydrolase
MKKKNAYSVLAALVLALLWFPACELPGEAEKGNSNTLSIMTWNMQALFDGIDDGNEYDEYLMSAGWSKEKYQGRISVISKAISGMSAVPDILAIQEIESEQVINDLAAALSGTGNVWAHFAKSPDMSLGVGIISNYPIMETKTHSINIDGDAPPRPVLEVRINAEKPHSKSSGTTEKALVLFICHWKSKLGGESLTEETRRASARVILRRIRELAEQEPDLPVIIMGDLNENYDEFYRRNGEEICALLPDDPRSAEIAGFYNIDHDTLLTARIQKDFLIISKNKPPQARYFSGEPIVLYSPWMNDLENGSYYYKNAWETIDHFLLSAGLFNSINWVYDTCSVINYPPFASTVGRPMAYNPRTGSGLSDHLPLILCLKWEQDEEANTQ